MRETERGRASGVVQNYSYAAAPTSAPSDGERHHNRLSLMPRPLCHPSSTINTWYDIISMYNMKDDLAEEANFGREHWAAVDCQCQ